MRGYIDHEAAHIRHTDFDVLAQETMTPLEKHIWNSFEDWRVEQQLAARFPGCRQNFHWLIRHLFLDQPASHSSDVVAVTAWLLLTVRSWSVPELHRQCQNEAATVERLWPGLISQLEIILAAMRGHCPNSLACLDYARQVVRCLEGRQGLAGITTASDFPDDLGQILKGKIGETAQQVGRCSVATIGEKPLMAMTAEDMAAIARVTAGLRARLHGLVQASRLVRTQPSRQGKVNPHRLHGVMVDDPMVFQTWGRRPAINTALHILLDTSASMRERIGLAGQCCAVLTKALMSTGVSVALTAFPGIQPGTVVPLLKHGHNPQIFHNVEAKGQTPLGEALWWVLQRLVPVREDRKIVLIITDGAPDNPATAREAIRSAHLLGIEVLGLGIDAAAINSLLPGHSIDIQELNDLPSALFALLGEALSKNGRMA